MSLVLANDDSTESELTKTFTKENTLQRKHTAMVVVDRKGVI